MKRVTEWGVRATDFDFLPFVVDVLEPRKEEATVVA